MSGWVLWLASLPKPKERRGAERDALDRPRLALPSQPEEVRRGVER